MATEITTQTAGSGSLATLLVGSHLPLASPTDVTLTSRNAQISGYEKSGADLNIRFADGHALEVQNFFVIGEQGDFSRLISSTGAPLVTGLMGPEAEDDTLPAPLAEPALPAGAIEVFPNPALLEQAGAAPSESASMAAHSGATLSVSDTSTSGGGAGSWTQPTLLAGLGLASTVGLSSGASGDAGSSATTASAAQTLSLEADAPLAEGSKAQIAHEADFASAEDAHENALLDSMADQDSPYDIALILAPSPQPAVGTDPMPASAEPTPMAGTDEQEMAGYLAEILPADTGPGAEALAGDPASAPPAPEEATIAQSAQDAPVWAGVFADDAPSEQPHFTADLLSELISEADL